MPDSARIAFVDRYMDQSDINEFGELLGRKSRFEREALQQLTRS